MDTNQMLTVLLLIALAIAFINLYTFWRGNVRSEAKKRLNNLYYPLHSIIASKNKYVDSIENHTDEKFAIEYYKFFLELRKRYVEDKNYASPKLRKIFLILLKEHNTREFEECRLSPLPEEVIRNLALFEHKYKVDKDGLSQLQRNLKKAEEIIIKDMFKMRKRL